MSEASRLLPPHARADMVRIPGGVFRLGSDRHYPEEGPAHDVRLDGFWMDRTTVTNDAFRAFVSATGYQTVAERSLNPDLFPGADPAALMPGALVFRATQGPANLCDPSEWWHYVPGACWHRPEGPGSGLVGRGAHPVVQIAYEDAVAYAAWSGKDLPTEAEWEASARGGLHGADYAWGDAFMPEGRHMANTWQGEFPWRDLGVDGFAGTAPVASFPPNAYGLFDMTGNVWQWTADRYAAGHARVGEKACCAARRSTERIVEGSTDPHQSDALIPSRVVKGGSFLCAPGYCQRYRPAARQPQAVDTATCHIGFRCVVRGPARPPGLDAEG